MKWFAAALALASLAVSGCGTTEERVFGDLPIDTAFVAVMFEAANGTWVGGTPLIVFETAALEATIERNDQDAARVQLYAWTSADLASVIKPDDTAFSVPLRYAATDEPALPAATWTGARESDEDGPLGATTDAPPLTARWLPPCPSLLPSGADAFADVRCLVRNCGTPPEQRGCTLSLDLTACGLDVYEAEIDGRGRVIPRSSFAMGCSAAEPVAPAVHAVVCDRCRIELFSAPRETTPFVDVEHIALVPPIARAEIRNVIGGPLTSLTILGDVAVASAFHGTKDYIECSGVRRSKLFVIDVDTKMVTRTATKSGCLHRLARDVAGDGFVAIDTAPTAPALVRFDLDLVELERISLDGMSTAIDEFLHPSAIIPIDATGEFVIGATALNTDALLTFVRGSPLAVTDSLPLSSRRLFALALVDGLVVAGQNGEVELYDAASHRFAGNVVLGTGDGIETDPHHIVYLPGPELLLSSNHSSKGGLVFATLAGDATDAGYYERYAVPTVTAPIGRGHRALAVVVARDGTWESGLVRVDALNARFLPGTIPIGTGPAVDFAIDRNGVYWGALAWDGQVFTATLR